MYVPVDGFGRAEDPPQWFPWGVPAPTPPIDTPVASRLATLSTIAIALLRSRLQCSAAQLAAIKSALGPGTVVTADTIATAVAQDDGLSLLLADLPRYKLLVPTPSANTVSVFTQAFGQAPTKLPRPEAKQNLGWIVATRLGGARDAMLSCSVRISCWGWPWSGGGLDRPMDYMVKALPKQARVALGALFWRAVAQTDRDSVAAAMLAAGLVIRYGVSYQMLAQPLSNLHCYLKYSLMMLGRPVPPWVTAKCPVVK
jgi:hypothetical protein